MIVPMKKITIIVQAKDAQNAIKRLRSLGLVHVEHQRPPKSKDISALHDDISLAANALGVLAVSEYQKSSSESAAKEPQDWKAAAAHVVDTRKRLDHLEEFSRNLKAQISAWEEWGDFQPERINELGGKGIHIRLYQIPIKEMKNIPASLIVKTVSTAGGMVKCAIVSREKVEIQFKEVTLPRMSLGQMKMRLAENVETMRTIREDMSKSVVYRERLAIVKKTLEKELELAEAISGMGEAGLLSYLSGYLPAESVGSIKDAAKSERWGLVINDPSDEDNVPTLIRTPKWASIIKPVFKLLEILPGYRELDVSPLFLLFLGLFFGMIIGDAGYGALYMLLTFLAQKKLGRRSKDKMIFRLLYYFSSWAIFWGILTGTVFGQEWYLKAGFKPLIPVLNDTKFLQAFCFLLGAFHLTLAHAWQAIRKAPSLTALADVGWIMVLWSAFFFARMLILNDSLPHFVNLALIAGISLVILFTSPHRNILKTVLDGLGTVALSIMNNFTDVVSYVRLFAVGLAGVAISDTVNTLASVFGGDNILIRIAIVFIGHTINMTLGPISVLVHGIRLNVLEFSSHIGLTWSGISYRPLQLLEKE